MALGSGISLPTQGWKIHVSATSENAQAILTAVAAYAHRNELNFKFIPTEAEFLSRNSKEAHRGSSGKFITVYPHHQPALQTILTELDQLVGGRPGPYILSDLRWNDGPLFVRYGGFRRDLTVRYGGEDVPAIISPDGSRVPDRREAQFVPPSWVEMPLFLQEQIDALGDNEAPESFPYRIQEAIHFSNAGGVYRAQSSDAAGKQVILKEARPFAGLTPDRRDAVSRLAAEAEALRRLADDDAVADLHKELSVGDHHFLAIEEINGTPLNKLFVTRNPLLRADATLSDYIEYREWALDIIEQLDAVVGRIHAAGLYYGDLHPANVLVTDDGHVVLIDFEMSGPLGIARTGRIGAPGFTPPARLVDAAADDWSLAAVKLFLFLPLTALLSLDSDKARQLINAAARIFALPEELRASLMRTLAGSAIPPRSKSAEQTHQAITRWPIATEDDLFNLQIMLNRSIDASLDRSRADRCYPGDPQQFRDNGWNLANGAAGVIAAQLTSGLDISPYAVEWLAQATDHGGNQLDLGLYSGAAGVGWLWRRYGDDARADSLLGRISDHTAASLAGAGAPLGSDLHGGLSGIGIYLLDQDAAGSLELCDRIADELARRLEARTAFPATGHRTGKGLMWGPSGLTLFTSRLYEHTHERRHLELARAALQVDLDDCVEAVDGSLQLDEGWRLMPYLATGSAGVGLAAAQLAGQVPDPDPYQRAVTGIQKALQVRFSIESGVFTGRAGFLHVLAIFQRLGFGTADSFAALYEHLGGLQLHALHHSDGIAFAGGGLLRASSDYATGTAGVLSAIQAATMLVFDSQRDGWRDLLPLLAPPTAMTRAGISRPVTSKGGDTT